MELKDTHRQNLLLLEKISRFDQIIKEKLKKKQQNKEKTEFSLLQSLKINLKEEPPKPDKSQFNA